MILDHAKLGHIFSFMKDLASIVTLNFLPKTLISNKMAFPASNSLKLAGLVINQLKKAISKTFTNIHFYIQFITSYCKDFKRLELGKYITYANKLQVCKCWW